MTPEGMPQWWLDGILTRAETTRGLNLVVSFRVSVSG